jgi:hypothetical protein
LSIRQLASLSLGLLFTAGCSGGGSTVDAGTSNDGAMPSVDTGVATHGDAEAGPPADAAGGGDANCVFPIDASGQFQPVDSGLVPLTAQSIASGAFFTWIERTPSAAKATVLAQIAAGNNPANVTALNTRLDPSVSPVTDLTDEFMLLAVVGQLKDQSSTGPLLRLIGLAPNSIFNCKGTMAGAGEIDIPDCDVMIRARATEMLAYIEAASPLGGSLSDVLNIAATHPSVVVRRAAMDAYLFNMGDTPSAVATLRAAVQATDSMVVDRARFTTAMDGGAFDQAVTRFYAAHPEQLPPPPMRGGSDAGVTHVTCP